jgi:hypothetical protein
LAAAAGTLSWLMPLGSLGLVGLSEKASALVPFSSRTLVEIATAASVAGLALGGGSLATRFVQAGGPPQRAILGMALSAMVLAVVGVATVSGAASGRNAERALRAAAQAAVHDFPSWNGGALVDGCRISAFEVDTNADLAGLLLRPYRRAFRIVMLGADNRSGTREILLDVEGARLRRAGGTATPSVPRSEVLANAMDGQSGAVLTPMGPVRVPAGERAEGIQILFPPSEDMRGVDSIEIHVDGTLRFLRGRYFTLEEKRAMDAASSRGPRGSLVPGR